MGYTITAHFRPDARHPAAFWWPLLFEALQRHGMSLDVPRRLPEHVGRYLPTDEASEPGFHHASFPAIWERLNDTTGRVRDIVSVWTPAFPGWEMSAMVGVRETPWNDPLRQALWQLAPRRQSEEHPVVEVWTGHLRSDPDTGEPIEPASPAVSEELLALLVAVACEIAEVCGPGTGELTYERTGVVRRFGAIGKPLELMWWATPTDAGTFEAPITRATLPSGLEVAAASRLPEEWTPGPLTMRLPT